MFWEIAYTLSDFHIQHIEELNEIPAVDRALTAALCDFADRVRDNRRSKHSRMSALCQNYIFNHLYEEITLGRLAEIAGLNPSYLSHLFKKETGLAVSDYIQRERIEEAKRLMTLPGITLSDIATRLHFNDQSYFTKVFKKIHGTDSPAVSARYGEFLLARTGLHTYFENYGMIALEVLFIHFLKKERNQLGYRNHFCWRFFGYHCSGCGT